MNLFCLTGLFPLIFLFSFSWDFPLVAAVVRDDVLYFIKIVTFLNLLFLSFTVIKHNVCMKTEMLNGIKGRGQGGINKEKKEDSIVEEQGKVTGKACITGVFRKCRKGDGKEGERRENLKSPENLPRTWLPQKICRDM